MLKSMSTTLIFISILCATSSCSWIDRKLAQSNGEYYQTFNCTKELAVLSTQQIIQEMNYSGVIVNEDGKHTEIWFKINKDQRARIRFTQHYFWDTIISYYATPNGDEELSDQFYTKLHRKIFGTKTEDS